MNDGPVFPTRQEVESWIRDAEQLINLFRAYLLVSKANEANIATIDRLTKLLEEKKA